MVQDIVDGITDFFGSLGAGILDFFISLIYTITNIVLYPINALINSISPDFTSFITTFSDGVVRLASAPIGYFAYHIPPITKTVILLYLTIMVGYYSIIWVYRGVILIPIVINKIKFW